MVLTGCVLRRLSIGCMTIIRARTKVTPAMAPIQYHIMAEARGSQSSRTHDVRITSLTYNPRAYNKDCNSTSQLYNGTEEDRCRCKCVSKQRQCC